MPLENTPYTEVTPLFRSYCARRRGPICRLDGSSANLFTILACCLVVVLSGCGYTPNGSAGPLRVSPSVILFGAVPVGQTATIKVSLLNQSSAPVDVSKLNVAGQNFSVNGQSILPVTISVGGTYSFNIAFTPANASSYSGVFTATNGASSPIAQGSIDGLGISVSSSVPALTVSADNLTFGNVTLGSAATQPVTLTSTGTSPVTISSATLTGTGFTMSGAAFPVTLNPSQSVTLNVQFDPTATGAAAGHLNIQSDSPVGNTAVVNLSGTGTAAPSPQLTISTASLTFGNVTVNTVSTKPVTLTSTGTAPLTIKSAAVTGTGFTISGAAFPVALNPSQSVTLNAHFDPTVTGAALGQRRSRAARRLATQRSSI